MGCERGLLAMAQFYARVTLPGMMGMWGVKGPLAGLTMLSGLLMTTDLATAFDQRAGACGAGIDPADTSGVP